MVNNCRVVRQAATELEGILKRSKEHTHHWQVGYTPGDDGTFFMCAEDLAQTIDQVASPRPSTLSPRPRPCR